MLRGNLQYIMGLNGKIQGNDSMCGKLSGGGKMSGGLSIPTAIQINNVYVDTTENWKAKSDLIGELNVVYVYTDRSVNEKGEAIPGFKVGDGLAYLIDLPFNDDIMMTHINNMSVHVTDEERDFWNNKVTSYINALDPEELILTKN